MQARADDMLQAPLMPLDYYAVLRLHPAASAAQVQDAYSRLSVLFDPQQRCLGPPEKVRWGGCACTSIVGIATYPQLRSLLAATPPAAQLLYHRNPLAFAIARCVARRA